MASIFQCAPSRRGIARAAFLLGLVIAFPARAVSPESPEARDLIERGQKYLEENTDDRLGGRCLIALVFLKDRKALDHPRVVEALEACQSQQTQSGYIDNYSLGLAIIFLSELNKPEHRPLIQHYLGELVRQQRKDGAWGYLGRRTGDTSQTQYAALSYWELMRVGVTPSVESADKCANWLMRTQDPSGTWGYQGVDPGSFSLVPQSAEPSTHSSMLAAGMGSLLIFGNILGVLQPNQQMDQPTQPGKLPAALKEADGVEEKKLRTLSGSTVDRAQLMKAIDQGRAWYGKNFELARAEYPCYVLYSLERFKSFEELLTGDVPTEPDWYQKGFDYLKSNQQSNGAWKGASGEPCETAFAILFLLRSTQKSIKASLGEGTLIGGRGLSADLSRMRLQGGRLVKQQRPTDVDKMLDMLEGEGDESLDELLEDTTSLELGDLGPADARRLQQIARGGKPAARLVAVRALSELRNLDYVPTLIYAMTDPDRRVVRAASDGLQFVSRRFDSFGLLDNFTEDQQREAVDKWKQWYRRVRPDAPPLP